MADEDLGITGKDVSWEIIVNGAPQGVIGAIANFTERSRYNTVEREHVGTTDTDIDKIPKGWEGDFEITSKRRTLEDAIDLYNASRRNRIPVNIVLHHTKRYRDGSTISHTYRQVQVEFETTGSRGNSVVHRVTWMTGFERITV